MTTSDATPRTFDLGDLLSIVPGALVSPRGLEGVYGILGFLTRRELMTHELPQASRAVEPGLVERHPWLADVPLFRDGPWPATEEGVAAYVAHIAATVPGATERVDVSPPLTDPLDTTASWELLAGTPTVAVVLP